MEERIYIGGLDPPRLTAKEVASRLDSIPGVQIRSKDMVGDDKTFFYVNAVAEDGSGLEKIARLYNNVTWKRCKIVVRAARPHFLERLAQERLQRQEKGAPAQEGAEHERKIPRHLRIRQKFGEEAHHVDTKPCLANDWSGFCQAVKKMRERREEHREKLRHAKQHDEKVVLAKKTAYLNRSVHLRWKETWDGNNGVQSLVDAEKESLEGEESTTGSTNASDQDETDDSEISSTESRPLVSRKSYVWSDDESDESSEDHTADVFKEREAGDKSSEERSADGIKERKAGDDIDDLVSRSMDESMSSESEDQTKESPSRPDEVNTNVDSAQHECASDSDEGPVSALKPKTLDFEESGNDLEDSDSDVDHDDSDNDDGDSSSNVRIDSPTISADLVDDVKSNLGVLSTLFPEMANTTPRLLKSQSGTDKVANGEDENVHKLKSIRPGWEIGAASSGGIPSISAGLGLMQRFDPTKESAKKYIIEPLAPPIEEEMVSEDQEMGDRPQRDEDDKELEGKSVGSQCSSGESNSDDIDAETKEEQTRDDTKTAVYEQNKLEDIFRQARASAEGGTFKLSSMFDGKIAKGQKTEVAGEKKKNPFAFRLDVGEDSARSEQGTAKSGDFAFSFDLGKAKVVDGNESKDEANVAKMSPNKDLESDSADEKNAAERDKTEQASTGIWRPGLLFPEDVLNEYTDAFFSMNEGTRILQDPLGFLHDEGVKRQWSKERQTLTLDWKRKRKYAQSRMQKKMKFR